jgi:hypothetical protein
MAEKYFIVCIYNIFFIHSSIDEHRGWFYNLTIVAKAVIHIGMQVFVLYANFDSFGYIPSSGITGAIW